MQDHTRTESCAPATQNLWPGVVAYSERTCDDTSIATTAVPYAINVDVLERFEVTMWQEWRTRGCGGSTLIRFGRSCVSEEDGAYALKHLSPLIHHASPDRLPLSCTTTPSRCLNLSFGPTFTHHKLLRCSVRELPSLIRVDAC